MGTWFDWDRTDGHRTIGPPCGNIWVGLKDSRAKLAPSNWVKLRDDLEKTNCIIYSKSNLGSSESDAAHRKLVHRQGTGLPKDVLPQVVLAVPKAGPKLDSPKLGVSRPHLVERLPDTSRAALG